MSCSNTIRIIYESAGVVIQSGNHLSVQEPNYASCNKTTIGGPPHRVTVNFIVSSNHKFLHIGKETGAPSTVIVDVFKGIGVSTGLLYSFTVPIVDNETLSLITLSPTHCLIGGMPRGQPTYLEKLDSTDQFTKSQYIPRYRR